MWLDRLLLFTTTSESDNAETSTSVSLTVGFLENQPQGVLHRRRGWQEWTWALDTQRALQRGLTYRHELKFRAPGLQVEPEGVELGRQTGGGEFGSIPDGPAMNGPRDLARLLVALTATGEDLWLLDSYVLLGKCVWAIPDGGTYVRNERWLLLSESEDADVGLSAQRSDGGTRSRIIPITALFE